MTIREKDRLYVPGPANNRLLTLRTVAQKLDRSPSAVYRLQLRDPRFPHPVKVPARTPGKFTPAWIESEVDEYIALLQKDRDHAEQDGPLPADQAEVR